MWNEILIYLVEAISGLVISAAIPYLFYIVKERIKNNNIKDYVSLAEDTVSKAVSMINQTFVDTLKKDGKFDGKSQQDAFNKCKDEVLSLLSENAKEAIIQVYGDLDVWIKVEIEAKVNEAKK